MEKIRQKLDPITLGVFLVTLIIVLISLTTVVFPSLIMGTTDEIKYPVEIDLFETGILAFPLLATNIILLIIGVLYFKNLLPQPIRKSINFILNFEVPARIAFLVLITLIGLYIIFNVHELIEADPLEDFERYTQPTLEEWPGEDLSTLISNHPIIFFLGNLSMTVFGSYRVIPFIASIALLVLTYAITYEISKKRFAGIIAVVIVLQSGIFSIYDSIITYSNFWILFYLLSLYLILTKWSISPISYILSILSKPMTVLFLPMTLFFILRCDYSNKHRVRLIICYGIIVILGAALLLIPNVIPNYSIDFDQRDFRNGFTSFSHEFRFDGLIVIFLLPVVVGLFFVSQNGIKNADSVMVLIMGMLLLAAIIPGFLSYTNTPYRFMPLVIFFAIGVGTLLSKRIRLT